MIWWVQVELAVSKARTVAAHARHYSQRSPSG